MNIEFPCPAISLHTWMVGTTAGREVWGPPNARERVSLPETSAPGKPRHLDREDGGQHRQGQQHRLLHRRKRSPGKGAPGLSGLARGALGVRGAASDTWARTAVVPVVGRTAAT
jgi:hypothetical protein